MSTPTVEAKIGLRESALCSAKALGLVLAGVIVKDETTGGYKKLVAGYEIDPLAGTCTCPQWEHNQAIAARIEEITTEILLSDSEKERRIKVQALQRMSPFEGQTCKHVEAARMVAGLVDLATELRALADPSLKKLCREVCKAEKEANLKLVATGDVNNTTRTVHTHKAEPPLLVPVIKVVGKVGKNAQGIRVTNTVSDDGRTTSQLFQLPRGEDGQWDRQAALATAHARYPGDRYTVTEIVVKAADCGELATL